LAKSLLWPLTKEKIEGILQVVERQKSSLLITLENDHLLLSAKIKKDTSAIRQNLDSMQKGVQNVAERVFSLDRSLQGMRRLFKPFGTSVVSNSQTDSRIGDAVSKAFEWVSSLQYNSTETDTYKQHYGGPLA
jgi:hypothetical protein